MRYRDKGLCYSSYYEGDCSWDYCSWWTKIGTPYLSQSVEKVYQSTTNKNELLRETICIINHICPPFKFVRKVVEILGGMGNSCTKEKPSALSSEKGKTKVSRGNKRP